MFVDDVLLQRMKLRKSSFARYAPIWLLASMFPNMDVEIAAVFGGVGAHGAFEDFDVGIGGVFVSVNCVADDRVSISAATAAAVLAHAIPADEIAPHLVPPVGGEEVRKGSRRPIQRRGGGGGGSGGRQGPGCRRQLRMRLEVHPG